MYKTSIRLKDIVKTVKYEFKCSYCCSYTDSIQEPKKGEKIFCRNCGTLLDIK